MTKTLTDVATTAQAQFLEALEGAQDAVLEGVRLWKGAVTGIVPDELVKNVPLPKPEWLPSPAATVNLGLDFAEKLFATQRAFAEAILAETTGTLKPEPPVTSPLVTVPATKSAAK